MDMISKKIMVFAITFAMIGAGFSILGLNVVAEDSARMFEELNDGYSDLKKIAWNTTSGDFALGVDGSDNIYIYDFTASPAWSVQAILGAGDVMNDIIYDNYSEVFYVVGNDIAGHPLAYEYDYVNGPTPLGSPDGGVDLGTFNGVCVAHEWGNSAYDFFAVGYNTTGDKGLACWYSSSTGWRFADLNAQFAGDTLYDVTWDQVTNPIATYYAVGENTGIGVGYTWTNSGDLYENSLAWPAVGALNTIDWQPSGTFAIIGGLYHEGGNLFMFDGGIPDMMDNQTGYNILDFDWSPDGTWGAAVGSNATGDGIYYNYYSATGTLKDMTYKLPFTGAPVLNGISIKGYNSPSSGLSVGVGGALGSYVSAVNSDTKLKVNTDVPHGYSVGMWDMTDVTRASTLDKQVDISETYTFRGEFNYSIGANDQFFDGADNVRVELNGWYDDGDTNPRGATAENRTKMFTALWSEGLGLSAGTGSAAMTYPAAGPGEFTVDSWWSNVSVANEKYYVWMNITFDKQTCAAVGSDPFFATPVAGDEWDAGTMLDDPNSWNFRFEVYDAGFPTATNYTYGEFGVFTYTDVQASGDPSANAPPGTSGVALFPYSNITCSANTPYYVNVSITDLVDGLNYIPAVNVSLQHVNITGQANNSNTEILNPSTIPGVDTEIGIWGNWSATNVLPAPGNGTTAIGPYGSDFNQIPTEQDTQVAWFIDVPAGTQEGQYEATITVTIGFY